MKKIICPMRDCWQACYHKTPHLKDDFCSEFNQFSKCPRCRELDEEEQEQEACNITDKGW